MLVSFSFMENYIDTDIIIKCHIYGLLISAICVCEWHSDSLVFHIIIDN